MNLSGASAHPGTLGGKGFGLARLVEKGHRVPPGLVVTVEAFEAAIDSMGIADVRSELARSIAAGEPRFDLGEEIVDRLLTAPFPPGLSAAIAEQTDRLRLWDITTGGLIVRSSATVEDSAALSFAGIFESITVESPEDVEDTVRQVWSSVFAPRAIAYAADAGVTEAPSMAVVIQAFLPASRSGVMFTTFGGDRTLIEHVEGGCEKLVKGEVIPDRLWLEHGDASPGPDRSELAMQHIAVLAQLAVALEEQFGGPQDVEWCVYDGEVHVLQTRPITAGFEQAEAADTAGAILTGVAASRGTGSGDVHLVFNIDQALALESGAVLVTPMTNPDMVVAMRNSAAIVTDVGGMICHAAIVSRELGLPCVVGTETATTTLSAGRTVTVDGSNGAVYEGLVVLEDVAAGLRAGEWADVWEKWQADGGSDIPLVSSVAALEAAPPGTRVVMLRPEIDLRTDARGLWRDLGGMATSERIAVANGYLRRIEGAARSAGLDSVGVVTDGLPDAMTDALAASLSDAVVRIVRAADEAVPLSAGLAPLDANDPRRQLGPVDTAQQEAKDTSKFFGHQPGVKTGTMPNPASRAGWWEHLPEYGRFHREWGTPDDHGEYEWLEVRPELVISALLKSLVQPGFEMVPRTMEFPNVPPLHIKWVKCRYHFRSDVFAAVWEAIVDATWDTSYMAQLMRRIRASYDQLAEVLVLFPTDDVAIRALSGGEIVALMTSWWPRWVEFFALCWFVQAQGDDILYPFVEQTVVANLAATGLVGGDVSWPTAADLILPTTPVMSGDYMASMGRLRQELLQRELTTADDAVAAIEAGDAPELGRIVQDHLDEWHWMRDRDLMFEPWDTPRRVIETALRTEPHSPADYAENLRRNLMALAFHSDLAEVSGRRAALNHAVRFLHDLNVERENHHVLWLKYSYPLRKLFLELERRWVGAGSLTAGDIWFLQAPELIAATRCLPEPLDAALVERVRNRRRGYEFEARFSGDETLATPEDDYY